MTAVLDAVSTSRLDLTPVYEAVVHHADRLGGGHGQHQHGEDLAHDIALEDREGDEVDVHREQHQLDAHQDDDDVLAVEENAHHPDGEEDGGDGQILGQADFHIRLPAPA